MFSDVASNQRNQLDLFLETKPNYPKQQVVMQLMDEFNTKISKRALK
ncbi:hypothetical protein [Candidatus Protochlamydia amoebophila]|uniref:Uncharacterized protein n=1 Tax=Candidatus Protochlamydia amoebophila TaxID=362787 RepID=A0A0C1H789_9BACT|nr:hypothetical protein [Candidatus Protochlamydia amoebophila]KIC70803.1 hypothetical protein DB44_FT00010 [Candidatus Protochlamydia amoebophila]